MSSDWHLYCRTTIARIARRDGTIQDVTVFTASPIPRDLQVLADARALVLNQRPELILDVLRPPVFAAVINSRRRECPRRLYDQRTPIIGGCR
jgi:hypothetical protein